MKRTMILLLCLILVLCAAGCNGAGTSPETPPGTSPSTPAPTTTVPMYTEFSTQPTPPQPTEPAVPQIEMHAYANHVYTSPNYEGRYNYTMRLSENHTFQISGSPYLSTFMMGTWVEADGELVLISRSNRYYFQITESGFTFLRSRSDSHPMFHPPGK